ncbi:fatty acyl-CoA reductase 1-like [Branchiostoma floridae]|uniref:Fatty acyl-CoA reductase n=1 Tax=Branchiostoma floridae TaxID=7739 RepID=A0A9J7KFS6_BRAFL|nr:fatty acyl-CoA reductase 1-like [Branchiostoma floridae]
MLPVLASDDVLDRPKETIKMTSAIADFYKDKNVFVTGATGFLGKVLVEKLLRSCPEVKGIYLLIRPRGPQTVQERLNKMVECKLFDKVRHEQPTFHCKLHAIPGEMCEPDLGISQSDQGMLVSKIHILFHAAATVNFNAPLKASMQLNVVGTRYVIALCHDLKHLQAFVHVSTAYANCDRSYIEEVIYPSPVQPLKLIDTLEWMDNTMVTKLTPDLIGKRPNTYTFTKACTEYLLTQEAADLPLSIVRPSIIGGSWREPLVVGTGLLRFMRGKNSAYADIVPVDMTANLIIAAAWDTAVSRAETIPVYNVTSGGVNPLKWGEFSAMLGTYFNKHPLDKLFRTPNITFINNSFMYQFWQIVSHKGPAFLYDIWLSMIGQKPKVWKMYEKVERALSKFEYFTSHHWEWSHDNTDALMAKMGTEDKKIFNFDYRGLHWPTYMENYVLGMKKYVLKEDMDHLPMTKARLNRLRNIPRCFNTILIVVVWRVLIARTKIARNIWHLVVSLCFKFLQYLRISSKRGH